MRTALRNKLWEATISILPIALIVLAISFTPLAELSDRELGVFLLSSLLLILGIGLFNLGADLAMTPMGEHTGEGLTQSNRPALLLGAAFVLGLLITVAEPDLSVLAGQVRAVLDGTLLVFTVGVGVGLFDSYSDAAGMVSARSTHPVNPQWQQAYRKSYAIWSDIYGSIKPLNDRIAGL